MDDLQKQIDSLRKDLKALIANKEALREELYRLKDVLSAKNQKEKSYLERIYQLEEENNKLKVASAISGNEEYKKLMKLRLNKLIKEIDLCIVELKSSE